VESTTWGIDLGTTNSSIAQIVDGKPAAIPIHGSPLVPSVVRYAEDGRVFVGREARNTAVLFPENTVRSVKRAMGKAGTTFQIGGQHRTPQEVSAEILRELIRGAQVATAQRVDEAVITVPAYFDEAQRRATLEASERAGLAVLRLLSEPTSAALVYEQLATRSSAQRPENLLVYDLGGGTFDVSVLEVFEGAREVKATAGDTALGGDDFDKKLLDLFLASLLRDGVRAGEDRRAMCRLWRLAEEVKIKLSTDTEVHVREEIPLGSRTISLALTVSRRQLEGMISDLLDRTIDLAEKAVRDAGLEPEEIDQILLVGGSTRIPLVGQLIKSAFPAPAHGEIDPDLCVSLGAAVQAGLLKGVRSDRILVDVAAHSLGTRVAHRLGERVETNRFAEIIPRNSVLPSQRAEEFYTMVDRQERVSVEVYQGESPSVENNLFVGSFEFKLKPKPTGSPVRVELSYDLNGVVQVHVNQPGTANKRSDRFALSGGVKAPAAGEAAETEVAARARRLLSEVDAESRGKLEGALSRWDRSADPEMRKEAEDALLDLFVEIEGRSETLPSSSHAAQP